MCGIYGLLSPAPSNPDRVRAATGALAHRGPDGDGFYFSQAGPPFVALGHRRLSVIDLEGGRQPLYSEDGSKVIVFNGEIYNYRELREDLLERGHRFRTESDTEVLLQAFEQWGEAALGRLEGMFAFAIFDERNRRLFAARDPMGEKPFFYGRRGATIGFCSELLPLAESLGADTLNPAAVAEYMTHGFISGAKTYYADCQRLPPGHYLTVHGERLEVRRYWEPPLPGDLPAREEVDLLDELDRILRVAVRRRLVSDVPLGAFLSGGLDSSLITALMCQEAKGPVRTFSIGFRDPSYDETSHARAVSRHLGTEHTENVADLEHLDDLEGVLGPFGEPFADPSAIPTLALCRVTRRHVTVALSGDGGDELFGGYRRYLGRRMANLYLKTPGLLRRALEAAEAGRREGVEYYGSSVGKKLRLFLAQARRVEAGTEIFPFVFSPDEACRLLPWLGETGPTFPQSLVAALSSAVPDPVARMMSVDLRGYLPEDIFVKVDRMSMQCSLEVRAPLMDREVVRFSQELPLRWKIRGFTTKHLLKRLALRYLPAEVVKRPKQGFAVPVAAWFRGELGERYLDLLRTAGPAVDGAGAENLLRDHRRGLRDHGQRLWTLLVLLFWLTRGKTAAAVPPSGSS